MNIKGTMINKFKKIVIKIGSSSIIHEKTKKIKDAWLKSICKDIASIHKNKKVLFVRTFFYAINLNFIYLYFSSNEWIYNRNCGCSNNIPNTKKILEYKS